MDLEALRQVPDALARARQAGEAQETVQSLSVELSRIRREAIEELLLKDGVTKASVAQQLGMTRGRVGQLVASGPPPERLFFGDGRIAVAMGAKFEAEKDNPGQVLAREDMITFTRLQSLVKSLQLDAEPELVPPPGIISLNRENLVVICGPRLSPILYQILESDPHLGFCKDEQGWYLQDKDAGKAHRSPQDSGGPGDIAYFGRLPRPDGRGYFLYMAGIHAAGPAGVIHYLENALPSLYRQVKRKRFSVLVSSTFDPASGEVLNSKLVSPVYLHDGRQS